MSNMCGWWYQWHPGGFVWKWSPLSLLQLPFGGMIHFQTPQYMSFLFCIPRECCLHLDHPELIVGCFPEALSTGLPIGSWFLRVPSIFRPNIRSLQGIFGLLSIKAHAHKLLQSRIPCTAPRPKHPPWTNYISVASLVPPLPVGFKNCVK